METVYVKFISETQVQKAPAQFEIDNRKYVGFTTDFLISQGYKPLVIEQRNLTESNAETLYEAYYVENSNQILQKWRVTTNS